MELKKKKQTVFLIVSAFLCTYILYYAFDILRHSHESWNAVENRKIENMQSYIDMGRGFLQLGQTEQAALHVERAIDQNFVDFYMITDVSRSTLKKVLNGKLEYFYSKALENPPKDILTESIGHVLDFKNMAYASTRVGDKVFTVGVINPGFYRVFEQFMNYRGDYLREILFVFVSLLLISLYYFKEISLTLKLMVRGSKKELQDIKHKSEEGEALAKGFGAFRDRVETLEDENFKLGNQVLSALKTEIDSGKKAPYRFDCTIVRTDINNFSHIFNHYSVEAFMSVINDFFTEVTVIVSRYGGVLSEFLGDEVIYYFKDDQHQNSRAIAISAVREINETAARFNKRVQEENGYGFFVKSALAHGDLRFGKQVNGHSLSGGILIETVRILSHIKEREMNTAYYNNDFAANIDFLCKSERGDLVELKGLPQPVQIYSYKEHKPLSTYLNHLQKTNVGMKKLTYYRSLPSVLEMLSFISESLISTPKTMNHQFYTQALSVIGDFKISVSDDELVKEYQKILNVFHSHCENHDGSQWTFLLSTAVNLSTALFDRETFINEIEPIFDGFLERGKSHRLMANIIEVYQYFNVPLEKLFEDRLIHHVNNRVLANVLIKTGRENLGKPLLRVLTKMLRDKRSDYTASALFVLGELASFYKKENLVAFETSTPLRNLVTSLRGYIDHDNEKVRRQALIAARKIQDESLNELIQKLIETDSLFEKDVKKHYAA